MQMACVCWYRMQHRDKLLFSFPAGYVFGGDKQKRIITGARMKAMGYTNGTPDIFIPHPSGEYHGLFVEMKTEAGRASKEQKAVMAQLEESGYKCVICRGIEDFKQIVTEYLKQSKSNGTKRERH